MTGQVIVRLTPPQAWTREATSLPSSPMSRACARAMQAQERRSHAGRLAGFGLDQNVRSDHVTPTRDYSTAITVTGHPRARAGAASRAWTRVWTRGREFPEPDAGVPGAGLGARRPRRGCPGSLPGLQASRIPPWPRGSGGSHSGNRAQAHNWEPHGRARAGPGVRSSRTPSSAAGGCSRCRARNSASIGLHLPSQSPTGRISAPPWWQHDRAATVHRRDRRGPCAGTGPARR